MTWRYAAYSLALELGQYDVDAMLHSMTALQFQEWLAFFKIREALRKEEAKETSPAGAPAGLRKGYGNNQDEQHRLSGDMLRSFQGYQCRLEKSRQGKSLR